MLTYVSYSRSIISWRGAWENSPKFSTVCPPQARCFAYPVNLNMVDSDFNVPTLGSGCSGGVCTLYSINIQSTGVVDREFIGTDLENMLFLFSAYMALGRLKEAAKYSHGVWEQFAGTF